MEAIGGKPTLGLQCPEIQANYFRFPSDSHVLYYRISHEGLKIVRFLVFVLLTEDDLSQETGRQGFAQVCGAAVCRSDYTGSALAPPVRAVKNDAMAAGLRAAIR